VTGAARRRPERDRLRAFLLETGAMSPGWAEAFDAVDRAAFLPDRIWPHGGTGETGGTAVDRRTDPDAWYRWADTDVALTTQWDDATADTGDPGEVSTSSSSMPSVVASMLRDLDVRPGMRVLEVGTGTGWSSALLTARLGGDAVTSVEVDPVLVEQARRRLDAVGLHPHVVVGDGLLGHPCGAPYDRVVVTCGLRQLPYAWVEQTRPGGVVLAPWGTDFSPQDAVARLVVSDDGASAAGRFTGPVQFMKARSQRLVWPRHNEYVREWPGDAVGSTTEMAAGDLGSGDPNGGEFGGPEFLLGLVVPACAHSLRAQDGGGIAWFYGLDDRSWAAVRWEPGAPGEVWQSGPRRLWDEVEAAWRWWVERGRPGVERFGLTVDASGHRVWLDTPHNRVGR
jgi:protein-L-isoaspartate O-methyltransferase